MSDTAPEVIQFGIKETQFHPGISTPSFVWPIAVLVFGGILTVAWVGFLGWGFGRLLGLY